MARQSYLACQQLPPASRPCRMRSPRLHARRYFETTGRVAESRQLLRSLVRDTEPPSQARVTASQQLLDFEIREGNPKLLSPHSSTWSVCSRDGCSLVRTWRSNRRLGETGYASDARAARGDILTAQEQSERSVLRAATPKPGVPLGSDLTADEIIKRLPGGTTLLVYARPDEASRCGVLIS